MIKKTLLIPPNDLSAVLCNTEPELPFSYEGPINILDFVTYLPSASTNTDNDFDSTKYFQVENLFNEIISDLLKYTARKNLGISAGNWGEIIGDIENLEDLVLLIKSLTNNKLDADYINEESTINKIAYNNELPDLNLNSDYTKAVNAVLDGGLILSLKDVLDILMYTLFPVVYTDWSMTFSNTNINNISIEKGTKHRFTLDNKLCDLTIKLNAGNRESDKVLSLIVNGKYYFNEGDDLKFEYVIPITFRDILGNKVSSSDLYYDSSSKISQDFEIVLITTEKTITNTYTITQNITTFLYCFYYGIAAGTSVILPGDTLNSIISEKGVLNNTIWNLSFNIVRTTNRNCVYQLGDISTDLYVFAPSISSVKTQAVPNINDNIENGTISSVSGILILDIKYVPENGQEQNYKWIRLDAQKAKIKIMI